MKSIHLIEVSIYLMLGLIISLSAHDFSMLWVSLLMYIGYLVLNRVWTTGEFTQKAAILAMGGFFGTLLYFGIFGLIRLLAFSLYTGDDPVYIALFGPQSHWSPGGKMATPSHSWKVSGKMPVSFCLHRNSGLLVTRTPGDMTAVTEVWDVQDGHQVLSLTGLTDVAEGADVAATLINDDTISLHRLTDGELIRQIEDEDGQLKVIALDPGGRYLAAGREDGTVVLWDAQTGQLLHTLKGNNSPVCAITFSPDGALVAAGVRAGNVHIWQTQNGQYQQAIGSTGFWSRGSVADVWISPDKEWLYTMWKSELYAASDDFYAVRINLGVDIGEVEKYHMSSGKRVWGYTGEKPRFFTINGRQGVLYIKKERIELDLYEEKTIRTFKVGGLYTSVALAKKHRWLVAGLAGVIYIWDDSGNLIRKQRVTRLNDWVLGLAVSPDEKTMATGATDGSVRLWDLETGTIIFTGVGHSSGVNNLVFSKDGSVLVSADLSGTINAWALDFSK